MPIPFELWLTSFTSILFIVDPIAAVPIFITLTAAEPGKRRAIALQASLACGAILILFAVAGTFILNLYGITLAAFRASGGLILLLVALDMLRARRTVQGSPEDLLSIDRSDVALTPLATPLLAGPGAISTVMVLAGSARSLSAAVPVFAAVIFTTAATYITLRLADPIDKRLGPSGRRALTRVMGLLVAAVAMQLILDGLYEAGFTRVG